MKTESSSKLSSPLAALAAAGLGVLALTFSASGAGSISTGSPVANRYIGAGKCKSCHRSEESGDQFGTWEKMKHAQAFHTLGTAEAIEQGKKSGVASPQESEQCLRCHVTGFGEPEENFKKGFDPKLGVQCESCHGPGEAHLRARFAGAADAEPGKYVEVPPGEIVTSPPVATCLGCHNEESPTFEGFCYYERASKVRHLDPRKPRTEEEKAAMLVCGCETCECKNGCDEHDCGKKPEDG